MSQLGTTPLGKFFFGMALAASRGTSLAVAPADRTFDVPKPTGEIWVGYKTPDEKLNFSFDWENEIGADTIAVSQWIIETNDVTALRDAIDATSTIATVLLSGGFAANIYNITNLITTQSGLQLEASFRLYVQQYNE